MEMRRDDASRELGQPEVNEPAVVRFVPLLRPLPSELYGRTLDRGADGNLAAAVAPLILLALIGGGVFTLSSRVYRRLLETPEMSSSRRGAGEALALGTRSLPGLSPPTAAVAWTCVRTALRTVKGKLAIYTNPLFVAFFCLLLSREFEGIELAGLRLGAGALGALISVTFPMLSLQPVLLNFFAVDRAGLTLQFLTPISDRQMVRGKVAGGAILTLGSWMMCLAAAALVTREGPIALWLLTALGGVAGYLIVGPAFAMLSAVLAKAADLGAMGSRGNPNQFAALLSFPLMPVALGPIVILGLAGQVMFGNLLAGVALMAVWTVVAAGISLALLHLAADILGKRRESLALLAQGR
jgi:hypothetical protein